MRSLLRFVVVEREALMTAASLLTTAGKEKLEGKKFEALVSDAMSFVGTVDAKKVRPFLGDLYGSILSFDDARLLGWRIAAGRRRIVEGLKLCRDFTPTEAELPVTLRLEDASKHRGDMYDLRFRIYTGRFAGLRADIRRERHWVMDVLTRMLGWRKEPIPVICPQDLVGCRCTAELRVPPGAERPRLRKFRALDTMKDFNRGLVKLRASPCHLSRDLPCRTCPLGHSGLHPCPRSTHSLDLMPAKCPKCRKVRLTTQEKTASPCRGCG